MVDIADIAARIHADMCEDDRNGYSWDPRFGGDSPYGSKTLCIAGKNYTYKLGSYDCSSSVITAWKLALQYTAYAGALNGASYTGNMREVFLDSGLFWADRTPAKRGDVYLNDAKHTAMCQDGGDDGVYGYDAMSQFSINEYGQVYGGEVGDQTGREAYICEFREYPWNTTLHYNGNADMEGDGGEPVEVVEEPQNNRDGGTLTIDGSAGYNTILDWQHQMGTPEDGEISGQRTENAQYFPGILSVKWGREGSTLVEAVQRKVGHPDPSGVWDECTSCLVQAFLVNNGYSVGDSGIDHYFGHDSVCGLQQSLNDGNIWQ